MALFPGSGQRDHRLPLALRTRRSWMRLRLIYPVLRCSVDGMRRLLAAGPNILFTLWGEIGLRYRKGHSVFLLQCFKQLKWHQQKFLSEKVLAVAETCIKVWPFSWLLQKYHLYLWVASLWSCLYLWKPDQETEIFAEPYVVQRHIVNMAVIVNERWF